MDQIGGRHAQRSFDISADTIQKGLDILFITLFNYSLRAVVPEGRRSLPPLSSIVRLGSVSGWPTILGEYVYSANEGCKNDGED
jgi:hypothetical protein